MRSAFPRALAFSVAVALATGCASAPVDDADPNGTLTTFIGQDPNLDPATLGGGINVLSVFEPALRFDAKTLQPAAGAAQLPTISSDGLTYRLVVRDDAKFSDGTAVRAKDFAFGFSRLCDPAFKGPYAIVGYVVVGCADWSRLDPKKDPPEVLRAAKQKLAGGIRATGDKELTITLIEPAAYFSSILALFVFVPVREEDVAHGGDQWTEPATYIGNGPFVLREWRHNDRLILTPNRHYRSPSKLKQWTKMIGGPDVAVLINAYRHDEFDVLELGQTTGTVAHDIETDPALMKDVVRRTTGCGNWLTFNARRPPLDDANVRLALAKSFDRGAFVRDVYGGLGTPITSVIPPGLPGYDADDTIQRFDPAEARRILAGSRYAGATLPPIVIPHTLSVFERVRATWLRDQWKTNLGIDAAVEEVEGPALRARSRNVEGIPQILFGGWCADYPDPQNWLSLLFQSKSTFRLVRDAGFADPEFDAIVASADREPDPAKRSDLYLRASRLLTSRAIVAPLITNGWVTLRKPWVRGVIDSALDYEIGLFAGQEKIYIAKRGR